MKISFKKLLKKNNRNIRYGVFIGIFIVGFILILAFYNPKSGGETKILVVGDMMFDRTIRKKINENGFDHIFSCVADTLKNYDYVVGNLEGPITANVSVSAGTTVGDLENMRFTFPGDTAKMLKKNNFGAVSIGNNHILNFGVFGLEDTEHYLDKAGVGWFGDPYNKYRNSLTKDKISFISFNQFNGDGVSDVSKEIKNKKAEGNIVIIFAHWGEEYVAANNFQKTSARAFIDAGADLVVGAHPHVIQEIETYKKKKIYYSLGNFIFDQWWEPAVRRGMGVEITIKDDKISTSEILFESSRDGRTCPI